MLSSQSDPLHLVEIGNSIFIWRIFFWVSGKKGISKSGAEAEVGWKLEEYSICFHFKISSFIILLQSLREGNKPLALPIFQ